MESNRKSSTKSFCQLGQVLWDFCGKINLAVCFARSSFFVLRFQQPRMTTVSIPVIKSKYGCLRVCGDYLGAKRSTSPANKLKTILHQVLAWSYRGGGRFNSLLVFRLLMYNDNQGNESRNGKSCRGTQEYLGDGAERKRDIRKSRTLELHSEQCSVSKNGW